MNVDTGEFRAISADLGALRADVDRLRSQLDAMDQAAAILARAGYGDLLPAAPRHAQRPRLRLVGEHTRPGGRDGE